MEILVGRCPPSARQILLQTLWAAPSRDVLSRVISQCPGLCTRSQPLLAHLNPESRGGWLAVPRGPLAYGGQRHMHMKMVQQTSCLAAKQAEQLQAWDAFCCGL